MTERRDPLQPVLEALVEDLLPTPADRADPARLAPGTRVGPYRILDGLGAGGMGEVYRAHDARLGRDVAVKVLAAAGASADALLEEARALARLSHPNVIAVFDVGAIGERTFLAMELVDGTTLRRWLDVRPRSWREVRHVMLQAGRGLAAAHAGGLVHRDFKPENVLVDADGRARIADFGLACASGTVDSHVVGTPAYMAPEQIRGGAGDAKSDQFSFCVTLHEAVYGGLPGTAQASRRAPSRLHAILERGLGEDPATRYPAMRDLLDALDREPRRGWLAAGALAAAATAALAVFAPSRDPAPPCAASSGWAGVWDPARKAIVRAAFVGPPYAVAAWNSVERTLDAYAARWSAVHDAVCAEPQIEVLAPRLACLDQRRLRVAALVDV